MGKQPYIPIYIGDWEQDTNCLSPLAEFALLKLIFKLFSSEKRGVFVANFRTLSVLFKSNFDQTKEIFQELIDNKILNITPVEDGKFEIISRRMIRESNISEIRSDAGKKGVQAKAKQTSSKGKAKGKQNPEYEYEYIYDNNSKLFISKGEFEKIFNRWVIYKKEKKEFYKTESSARTALGKLLKFSKSDLTIANEIIDKAIERGWSGFFEIETEITEVRLTDEENKLNLERFGNSPTRQPKSMWDEK